MNANNSHCTRVICIEACKYHTSRNIPFLWFFRFFCCATVLFWQDLPYHIWNCVSVMIITKTPRYTKGRQYVQIYIQTYVHTYMHKYVHSYIPCQRLWKYNAIANVTKTREIENPVQFRFDKFKSTILQVSFYVFKFTQQANEIYSQAEVIWWKNLLWLLRRKVPTSWKFCRYFFDFSLLIKSSLIRLISSFVFFICAPRFFALVWNENSL